MPLLTTGAGIYRAPAAGYSAVAVNFDGTNDLLNRGSSLFAADSPVGIYSLWVKFAGTDGTIMGLFSNNVANRGITSYRENDNTITVYANNPATGTAFNVRSTTTYTNGSPWAHILVAWNVDTGSVREMYINDVSVRSGAGTGSSGQTVDLNGPADYFVGGYNANILRLNGDLADVYVNTATTLDITNSTNRRKFISAAGKPVDLGSDGSIPTGSAPDVFLSGALASWHTNKGTGGGFTVTGALTAAGSSPSD